MSMTLGGKANLQIIRGASAFCKSWLVNMPSGIGCIHSQARPRPPHESECVGEKVREKMDELVTGSRGTP